MIILVSILTIVWAVLQLVSLADMGRYSLAHWTRLVVRREKLRAALWNATPMNIRD